MAAASTSTSNTVPIHVPRTARGLMSRSQEEEEKDGVGSWRDLPSDLYGQIQRHLPSRGDRVRLSAACRHWRVCTWQELPRMSQILPMRVTKTARGTHVVHVRGFSRLQDQRLCGVDGFVDSPAFAVAGLHWAIRIRYYPVPAVAGSDDDDDGHVGAFVTLLTEGVVARAYVGLLLVDQTTGLADTVIWDDWRTRFDAETADSCTRGTGKVATWSELKGSRFVRGDCLKIECVLDDVCRDPTLK